MTLEQRVREYVDVLYTPANAWGQHAHPQQGRSDTMLYRIVSEFGAEEARKALDAEFQRRKADAGQVKL